MANITWMKFWNVGVTTILQWRTVGFCGIMTCEDVEMKGVGYMVGDPCPFKRYVKVLISGDYEYALLRKRAFEHVIGVRY